jgi:hypothetical protein
MAASASASKAARVEERQNNKLITSEKGREADVGEKIPSSRAK